MKPFSSPCRLLLALLVAFSTMGVSECSDDSDRLDSLDEVGGESADWSSPSDLVGNSEVPLEQLAGDCLPAAYLSCGVAVSGNSADPNSGHTNVINSYPVAVGNYSGPEVAYAWRAQTTEEVTWSLIGAVPTEVNHDLFVLQGEDTCEAESAVARGFNSVRFDAVAGELYFLVVDGYDGDAGEYTVELECTGDPVDAGSSLTTSIPEPTTEVIFSPQPYSSSHLARTAELIESAERSIDLAMYSFRDNQLLEALETAVQRGVSVRALLESARNDRNDPDGGRSGQLEDMGIEVRWVSKIMHHKFVIIDGPRSQIDAADTGTLVSGSGNWSTSAGTRFDENTFIIKGDRALNLKFQNQYNLLWSNSRGFTWNEGIPAVTAVPLSDAQVDSAQGADVVFTSDNFRPTVSETHGPGFTSEGPEGDAIRGPLAVFIESARESVWVASGHLRSRQITNAILRAWEANPDLDIRVYLDGQEYTSAGYYQGEVETYEDCVVDANTDNQRQRCENRGLHFGYLLHSRGVPVRYKYYAYRWHYSYAVQMHHKYVIIDGNEVATGSYNFSNNAEHQTIENLVFFERAEYPEVVTSFIDNFAQIWETGRGDEYTDLLGLVHGDDPVFPIVFESMALTWGQVTELKTAIRSECPEINSHAYRTRPQSHQDCER